MSKKCRHEILLDSEIQANTKMKEGLRELIKKAWLLIDSHDSSDHKKWLGEYKTLFKEDKVWKK